MTGRSDQEQQQDMYCIEGHCDIGTWFVRCGRGGLEREALELRSPRAAKRIAAGMGKAGAAVHHVEQDVRVDVDVRAVHAAHSAHATHAAERVASAEHLGWVEKIVAVVVSSAFSTSYYVS